MGAKPRRNNGSGFGDWFGSTPYGDDPNDQYWIRAGIDYAKRTGFKKRYLLLILLAVVAYGIYNLLHFSPLEQVIIKKAKVNNLANLYITEASAGATTGFSYRFYLYDVTKDDKAFMASLENDHQPFMITTDKDALKKVENNAIYLSVKGTIYTFHSPADYLAGGSIYSVPVYLTASPY